MGEGGCFGMFVGVGSTLLSLPYSASSQQSSFKRYAVLQQFRLVQWPVVFQALDFMIPGTYHDVLLLQLSTTRMTVELPSLPHVSGAALPQKPN